MLRLPSDTPRRNRGAAAWLGILLAIAPARCTVPRPGPIVQPDATPPIESDDDTPPPSSVFNRPMQRYVVEFSVHRISAPQGTFSADGGIWKGVTGPLSNSTMTLRLAANGIRAAVGQESDRSVLVGELSKLPGPRIAPDHVLPDPSRCLELELGPCAARQSIFHYDGAGAMHGFDFVQAKALLKLTYEMRFANLREVWLEIVPEVEEPPGPRVWVRTPDGRFVEKEEVRRTTFTDLAFSAKVSEGGFLLVGPAASALDQPLLGRTLFIEELQSPGEAEPDTRENIYVISPIIRVYTDRAARPKAAP